MQTFQALAAGKPATRGVWVIIPVKSLSQAKSRLASNFTPAQRHRLTINLLKNTLKVLASSTLAEELAGLLVVSADRLVLAEAQAGGAVALNEKSLPLIPADTAVSKLNSTLKATAHWVRQELNPQQLVILHADLPLLAPPDLQAMLNLSRQAGVVLAPDRHGQGTNAVLIEAAGADSFNYLFGPDSFQLHCKALANRQVAFEVLRQPGLAYDLDRIEDFNSLPESLQRALLL